MSIDFIERYTDDVNLIYDYNVAVNQWGDRRQRIADRKYIGTSFGNFGAAGTFMNEVKKFQIALIAAGFSLPKYGVDGKWGNEARNAMKSYQGARGFGVTVRPNKSIVDNLNFEAYAAKGLSTRINLNELLKEIKGEDRKPPPVYTPDIPDVVDITTFPPPKKETNWLLIGGGLAAATAVVLALTQL